MLGCSEGEKSQGGSAGSSGNAGESARGGGSGSAGRTAGGTDTHGGEATGGTSSNAGGEAASGGETSEPFSFFYTSLAGMRRLSKSQDGFGGDLRFGKATGLEGADEICRTLAAEQGEQFGKKTWRAYLSVHAGPDGKPVNAVDRIGEGPWYDRLGRLIAQGKAGLYPEDSGMVSATIRPDGDPAATDDFPDESGIAGSTLGDVHDAVTGSDVEGKLNADISGTCDDWTSATRDDELIAVGHSFSTGKIPGSWSFAHSEFSCAPSVNTSYDSSAPAPPGIGSGGGYGGFYCFALEP